MPQESMLHPSAEQQVIAKLKAGDIHALTPLVKAHQHRALHVAYLITQDQAHAEDIVQAAFLRAFDGIRQFDATRRFLPWFLRIVVNLAVQSAQKQARTLSLETLTDTAPDDVLSLADALPDQVFDNPEVQLEIRELEDQIQAYLLQLSPPQRAAIVMRYYVDYTEAEMATVLKVPKGTIKSRLFHARQQLRRLMTAKTQTNEA